MHINRRTFLLFTLAAAGCSRPTPTGPLRRAAEYLWRQQASDGGFHSSTYGLLSSGQSLTPFVLNALLDVPDSVVPRPDGAIDRALGFIRKNTNSDGALGLMDESSVDYPNYASALAVTVMAKVRAPERDIAPMVEQLREREAYLIALWASALEELPRAQMQSFNPHTERLMALEAFLDIQAKIYSRHITIPGRMVGMMVSLPTK